jgi:hypothetical protein
LALRAGKYTIQLDGIWSLEDLYVFLRTYEQVYFAAYSLMPELTEDELESVIYAYNAFPWQGGYSAVNFYNQLKYAAPQVVAPKLVSISYASPGWMELTLLVSVALNIQKVIKSVCESLNECNETYTNIIKGMKDRKLMRLETRRANERIILTAPNQKYVEESSRDMANVLQIEDLERIDSRTGHPYRSLKIFLSLYRRIRVLAGYHEDGQVNFTNKK